MNYFIAHAILYLLLITPAIILLWIQKKGEELGKTPGGKNPPLKKNTLRYTSQSASSQRMGESNIFVKF